MIKKLVLALFVLFTSYEVNAQASIGFANNNTPGLSDTLIKNSTITYGVFVQNTGTQPFVSPFIVLVGVLDSAMAYQNIDSIFVGTTTLQPGDTTNVLITHTVDGSKFMDGGNTVVIWPEAPGYITTDTIYKNVFVIDFNDLEEFADNEMIIYPNPVHDFITIRSDQRLEKVRIYDLNGKLVLDSKNTSINISGIQPAIYLIEIKDVNGKILRRKIVVE